MKLNFSFLFLSVFLFSIIFVDLINAHTISQVTYNQIEIKENIVKFINYNDGNSYFIFADNVSYRPILIDTVKIKNNGQLCELKNFLDVNTSPVFFIAQCKDRINYLEIKDSFLKNHSVDKVYFVNHSNIIETFTGNAEISFNVTINQEIKLPQTTKENGTLDTTTSTTSFSEPSVTKKSGDSEITIFLKYFKLGLEHILSGPDHILFIVGYILLSMKLSELLKGISGFTISHSTTLTLAALGILVLPAKIVEPLIALSIAVVGILAILDVAKSWLLRFGIIFGFGLFHGLGFAGAIANVGFPKESFLSALFGFNVGIETGQLLVVALVFPILSYLDKNYPDLGKKVRLAMACIVLLGGTYWLIERLLL